MESDIRIPPVTLNPRKTYILPTRYGYLFIILLLIMLIGSVNYNNNLGFLLTFLLSSMCVISLYYTNSNIKGIRIVSAQTEPVFSGDPALFELMVQVAGSDRFSVCFHFSDQPDPAPETLIAGEDNRIRISKTTGRRGIFKPGDVTISTGYPFGIFRAWSIVSMNLQCHVYPRPILHSGELQTAPSRHDGSSAPFTSGAEDFQGLTEYQPGDSLKRVSWKKVSAGQGLFTKKFDGLTGNSIVIDWYALAAQGTETRLSIMCGMILKAHRMNLEYGLRLPGITMEPASGNQHRHRCLQHLAVFSENLP
ncbi:MAG: DUF58 domain-containing protein [Pseudomonadota bacterium]